MPSPEPEPAERLRTEEMPWIPTSSGKSFGRCALTLTVGQS